MEGGTQAQAAEIEPAGWGALSRRHRWYIPEEGLPPAKPPALYRRLPGPELRWAPARDHRRSVRSVVREHCRSPGAAGSRRSWGRAPASCKNREYTHGTARAPRTVGASMPSGGSPGTLRALPFRHAPQHSPGTAATQQREMRVSPWVCSGHPSAHEHSGASGPVAPAALPL